MLLALALLFSPLALAQAGIHAGAIEVDPSASVATPLDYESETTVLTLSIGIGYFATDNISFGVRGDFVRYTANRHAVRAWLRADLHVGQLGTAVPYIGAGAGLHRVDVPSGQVRQELAEAHVGLKAFIKQDAAFFVELRLEAPSDDIQGGGVLGAYVGLSVFP
jgi:hypothetical protein